MSITQYNVSYNNKGVVEMENLEQYKEFGDWELRKKNIETILKYVNCVTDEEHLNRWKLYAEDGVRRVSCTTNGETYMIGAIGHDSLRESDAWNNKYFPDYRFVNNRIFQTQNPNCFVVLSEGKGYIDYPAYGGKRPYDSFFVHIFEMENGKIKVYSENMNYCTQFKALGIELPIMETPK